MGLRFDRSEPGVWMSGVAHAAIPAVLAYNKLQAEVTTAQSRLETFADEFSAILSRQIDERLALAA